jgi:hypothetical protein
MKTLGATRLVGAMVVAACASRTLSSQGLLLTPTSPTQTVAEALAKSRFVFTARVQRLNATTTGSVKATPNSVIVSVRADSDTVWVAPRAMRSISGRSITVVVDDPQPLSVGKVVIFFAAGLASDSGLALREVARGNFSPSDRDTYTAKLSEAREHIVRQRLRAAVGRSAVVVLARVDSVTVVSLPDSLAAQASFEHAPLWRRAAIQVERPFKPQGGGVGVGAVLRLLFPGSQDIGFRHAPKPVVGQRYVFLLRPASVLSPRNRIGIDPNDLYFVADSVDALPPSDTTRVRLVLP